MKSARHFIGGFSLAAGALALVCGAPTRAADVANEWSFTLTPYLWLPNINGTLKFDVPPGAGGSPEVETGPNNYLQNLNMVLMLSGEARKGGWAMFSDLIYLDLSGESATVKTVTGPGGNVQFPVNSGTHTGLKGLVWELAASYGVARSEAATFEVLGGFRYLGLDTSVNWQFTGPPGLLPQAGSFSQKQDLLDAIIGLRGKTKLGAGNWFIPYYLDAGTGSSALTWQGMAGIGYSYKWGDVLLAYRHLYYDQKNDKLLQNVRLSGPALGATFRF
ncbi:MAG TPA: hypothetical protein VE865_07445 [Bradyrhizobium sp.]|nr:hypothetical protein [Bradyrhizobium sp.]